MERRIKYVEFRSEHIRLVEEDGTALLAHAFGPHCLSVIDP